MQFSGSSGAFLAYFRQPSFPSAQVISPNILKRFSDAPAASRNVPGWLYRLSLGTLDIVSMRRYSRLQDLQNHRVFSSRGWNKRQCPERGRGQV